MKILAVDSSAGAASAAVTENEKILSECFLNIGLTHSQTLMPMIEAALKNAGLTIHDIDMLAVTNGPGSFTGVRIGVAAIKGLAVGAELPCCGISTLEAMAQSFAGFTDCIICGAMDARRSQVYTALFRCENGEIKRLTEDEAISIEQLGERLAVFEEPIFLVGDGAALCFKMLGKNADNIYLAPENIRYQRASGAAFAAVRGEYKPVSAGELEVKYLRLPQAERELKLKKEKGE